jgi:hypothetical protein
LSAPGTGRGYPIGEESLLADPDSCPAAGDHFRSFLFRFCGLVACAFTRALVPGPPCWERASYSETVVYASFWESASYSERAARAYLKATPEFMTYWLRIFISFGVTGTNVIGAS